MDHKQSALGTILSTLMCALRGTQVFAEAAVIRRGKSGTWVRISVQR